MRLVVERCGSLRQRSSSLPAWLGLPKGEYEPAQAGVGAFCATLEEALADRTYLQGDQFTMADVVVGSTVRWMLRFGMLDRGEHIGDYADRLAERPALQRANEINQRIAEERGITQGG